jgi:hypothetical protein
VHIILQHALPQVGLIQLLQRINELFCTIVGKFAEVRGYGLTDLCINVRRKEKLLLHSSDRAVVCVKVNTLDKLC